MVKDTVKYLHSGNLMLELTEDGGFANEQDAMLVRYAHEPNTASGAKIYIYRNDNTKYVDQMTLAEGMSIISRTDKFWSIFKNKIPTTHEDYVLWNTVGDNATEIPENALVWYNGIVTDVRTQEGLIPLEVLTSDFTNILNYEKTDTGYVFKLYTGIGAVKIDEVLSNSNWVFDYTLPENVTDTHESVTLSCR